jgi:hypothetical protein
VGLELATCHYRERTLAEKIRVDSRSTLMRMMCQRLRGFWISVN